MYSVLPGFLSPLTCPPSGICTFHSCDRMWPPATSHATAHFHPEPRLPVLWIGSPDMLSPSSLGLSTLAPPSTSDRQVPYRLESRSNKDAVSCSARHIQWGRQGPCNATTSLVVRCTVAKVAPLGLHQQAGKFLFSWTVGQTIRHVTDPGERDGQGLEVDVG